MKKINFKKAGLIFCAGLLISLLNACGQQSYILNAETGELSTKKRIGDVEIYNQGNIKKGIPPVNETKTTSNGSYNDSTTPKRGTKYYYRLGPNEGSVEILDVGPEVKSVNAYGHGSTLIVDVQTTKGSWYRFKPSFSDKFQTSKDPNFTWKIGKMGEINTETFYLIAEDNDGSRYFLRLLVTKPK